MDKTFDIRKFKNIVVLTGAGISAESGLKTFRDSHGLWEGHKIEEVATPEAFAKNPELVHEFYNLRRQQLNEVQPNAAHQALAEFEKNFSGSFTMVTQNVDDLHERAGSKNIFHIHGELKKVRCLKTEEIFSWTKQLNLKTPHPKGLGEGLLRPHICWFGEIPFFMDETFRAVIKADLFVAIGTSGAVYPAAGLVQQVPSHCQTVLINKNSAENSLNFSKTIMGTASQAVVDFFLH